MIMDDYFGYSDGCFETFSKESEAVEFCEAELDEHRGEPWPDETMNICYGRILGGTQVTKRIDVSKMSDEEMEEQDLRVPADCTFYEEREILPRWPSGDLRELGRPKDYPQWDQYHGGGTILSKTTSFGALVSECAQHRLNFLEVVQILAWGGTVIGLNGEIKAVKYHCPGCMEEVDPNCCWCGLDPESHTMLENHGFVAMGCNCHREKKES
jgi:hypothetical protein